MKRIFLFFFAYALTFTLMAQDKPAYILYNSKGKKIKYAKMVRALTQADIILFGEYHNDPIAHWLQLQVTRDLNTKTKLVLGAEMFETDTQEHLDAYLKDDLDVEALDTLGRMWSNYRTDYAPIVDFAKAHQLSVVATNIPRRYATRLFRHGLASLDDLTDLEKSWIVPFPFPFDLTLPSYQNMLEMAGGNENFPRAQAIKDATMAHFILKNYTEGDTFLHLNGSFHSDNKEGIIWYLKQERPELSYTNITTVLQDDIEKLDAEYIGKADFIICVPSDMTRTH